MFKWILDTNIIVHWLMTNDILRFLIDQFHLSQEFSTIYENRYCKSCDFINNILNISHKNHEFLLFELSLNEIFAGIRDEIRSVVLFVAGVPISKWTYKRETKEAEIPEPLSKSVYELAMRGFDTLFDNEKIRIAEVITPSDEQDYLNFYSSLVFLNPDLHTQDAILVTNAIFEKANYFVTTDKALIRLNKKLLKYELEFLHPETALQRLIQV